MKVFIMESNDSTDQVVEATFGCNKVRSIEISPRNESMHRGRCNCRRTMRFKAITSARFALVKVHELDNYMKES